MVDDLEFLGTYRERLPGESYEAKLRSFFKYISMIQLHEDWKIPGERLKECNVILTAAESILEKEPLIDMLEEAKVKFNNIRGRTEGSSKSVEDLVHYLS